MLVRSSGRVAVAWAPSNNGTRHQTILLYLVAASEWAGRAGRRVPRCNGGVWDRHQFILEQNDLGDGSGWLGGSADWRG